ncbi:NAP1-binding protein 2 [[Candida] jaroonii]|uniref:NAP1-binding protein 2 n=1 Tax=[Candida] jaroonii TaxID=467808 RepID=A0ACA9Y4T9_9ASCO|nr:NAP1-binding protein 2 [[Candida] jaroonii]
MEDLRFPENTSIKDFAYSKNNPLRYGNFEDEEEDYEYEYEYEYNQENVEINQQAIALFDFKPENDNEVELVEGQTIWISYRHGQGWLVAEDPNTGENGLVPEEYVEILDVAKPYITVLDQINDSQDLDNEDNDNDNEEINDISDTISSIKM